MSEPREVVVAALLADLPPGPERPRVEERADLIVAALVRAGHLPDPAVPAAPTRAEVEDVARWLAEESQHPRYTTGDGWRRILQSPADVSVAATAAGRAATRSGEDRVASAVSILTRWIHEHPPDPETPLQ